MYKRQEHILGLTDVGMASVFLCTFISGNKKKTVSKKSSCLEETTAVLISVGNYSNKAVFSFRKTIKVINRVAQTPCTARYFDIIVSKSKSFHAEAVGFLLSLIHI